jgi:tight adherence protein B
MTLPIVLSLITGLAVILVFLGLSRWLRPEVDVSARLGVFSGTMRETVGQEGERNKGSSLVKRVDRAMANKGFAGSTARDLARADVRLTVTEYVLTQVTCLIVLFLLSFTYSRNLFVGIALGFLGFMLPKLYVKQKQRSRLSAFNSQLGDSVTMVASSLRSGYSLLQSLDLVAREAASPTSDEFSRVVREVSLGLSPEEALANLVRRIGSEDLDLVVTAINVQHEVGGNLAQVLDSIATTIRERVRIKGEIRSLTSQQSLSGYVISLLPVALGAALFLLNSSYILQIFSMQRIGGIPIIAMPACSGMMIFAGFIVMRKIVAIDV